MATAATLKPIYLVQTHITLISLSLFLQDKILLFSKSMTKLQQEQDLAHQKCCGCIQHLC